MDDLPSIDELARRLTELGAFKVEQWDEFKRLELSSLSSARKEDAMMLFSRLPGTDATKQAMQRGLDDLRSWSKIRVDRAKASSPPKLVFISGSAGSGKSVMVSRVVEANPGMLVCCADDFKDRFKTMSGVLWGDVPEPARTNLGHSVYIHRLTALPSWEMVDMALEAGKDLVVEMLGMGAAEDERSIRRAIAKGYEVEVRHVGCSVEMSLARAARRHFQQKAEGGEGRWIGLASAAGKQRVILGAFAQLCELLKGSPAKLRLFDNTDMKMELAWSSDDSGSPPIERFAAWCQDSKLWRSGANPAADLCALVRGPDGRWRVALVERSGEPFVGCWALPGGFVKGFGVGAEAFVWGPEQAKQAALRRFSEETLCVASPSEVGFVGKFDAIERDPRNTESRWVESWVFCARFEDSESLVGGDGARQARWMDVDKVLSGEVDIAFDHAKLIEASVKNIENIQPLWARKPH